MYSSLSSYKFPFILFWLNLRTNTQAGYAERSTPQQTVLMNRIKITKKNSRHCLLKYTDLWTVESVLSSRLVQQVKEPLDGRREMGRHFQDRPKEVVHKLLDRPLGGEQPGQEDLRDGLVGARR
jgi:hypothetical protein